MLAPNSVGSAPPTEISVGFLIYLLKTCRDQLAPRSALKRNANAEKGNFICVM
ncbi:hypothetical protein NNRS527_00327 [Nitrosospira sp. NRS527]|nr:hypothetical protein NNRS527_00327 [Nitrosospira sp. NRS527]